MIARDIELLDGRTMRFHSYKESIVDNTARVVYFLTRSTEIEGSSDFVRLYTTYSYNVWDSGYLDYGFAISHISTGNLRLFEGIEKPEKSFQEIKSDKALEINNACATEIVSGYTSDALGTTHAYPSKPIDQTNMMASVTDSYNPENATDWSTPFWCADANGVWAFRLHTAQQIRNAGSAGKQAIATAQLKNLQIQSQITSATTQAELDLINW